MSLELQLLSALNWRVATPPHLSLGRVTTFYRPHPWTGGQFPNPLSMQLVQHDGTHSRGFSSVWRDKTRSHGCWCLRDLCATAMGSWRKEKWETELHVWEMREEEEEIRWREKKKKWGENRSDWREVLGFLLHMWLIGRAGYSQAGSPYRPVKFLHFPRLSGLE